MRVVLLAGASSIHTVRWANGLSARGCDVHVISQHQVIEQFDTRVTLHIYPYFGVLGYFLLAPVFSRLIRDINPDIINCHYASGYGTAARLINYQPWVLSVWGSDVYDFPHKSFLHKWLLKLNFGAADQIASTSHCMAKEVRLLMPMLNNIAITPFGVDMGGFTDLSPRAPNRKHELVIGTVKTMKPAYGIDTLIKAFALLQTHLQTNRSLQVPKIVLRLVGGGDQIVELRALADSLGIGEQVTFVGQVPHSQVPHELSKLDIYVALSRNESFGVAILEAGAACLPVVVSDVGGLPEVTIDGVTGYVVPRDNPAAAADAMKCLVMDSVLRFRMGMAARAHVTGNYSWDTCVQNMIGVYERTIQSSKSKNK